MIETYAEYGAVGVIVSLFVMMIVNLMKSQRAQNEDLDGIRQAIANCNWSSGCRSMVDRLAYDVTDGGFSCNISVFNNKNNKRNKELICYKKWLWNIFLIMRTNKKLFAN